MNRPSRLATPDFRNLGTMVRVIILAECTYFLFLVFCTGGLFSGLSAMGEQSALFQGALLIGLLVLFAAAPWLASLPFRKGTTLVMIIAIGSAIVVEALYASLFPSITHPGPFLVTLAASGIAGITLFYFHWRQLALSPALAEAKLSALQARIRPHFLYNSLNTVLGLIRQDPRKAESVLENLADLFRALMAEARNLVPLERELELARAYAEVESIRLGERLKLTWHCDSAPLSAEVPQLILQPLIENAVIHGIEPNPSGGEVNINILEKDGRILMVVRNTMYTEKSEKTGNRMAMANIRERLDLHFDAEARMTQFTAGGEYVVQIEIPLRQVARGRRH